MIRKLSLLLFFPWFLLAQTPGPRNDKVLLPNGWSISPVGEQVALDDLPLNAALSEDERYLAVTHSGASAPVVLLVDIAKTRIVDSLKVNDSWLGIKFVSNKLYVSGGTQNCVYVSNLSNDKLTPTDTIRFEAPQPKYDGAASGLDLYRNTLAVVFRNDSTLRYYNTETGKKEKVKLDGMPYACQFLNDGRLLVSMWSSKKVELFDQAKLVHNFSSGDHPTDITVSKNSRYAFVANANDNTVTLLDIQSLKSLATVVTSLYPDSPEGSTTNSVALSPDEKTVLAANADNNSLTVINLENPNRPTPVGFIPVGWYPTKVLVLKDNTVLVLNGKGGRSLANPQKQHIKTLLKGTLSVFKLPDAKSLAEYTKRVYENTPYQPLQLTESKLDGENPIPKRIGAPSPLKYVFYFIKENRTYDQVFGDIREGNGDSSLCLFGENISPNHHKLAREYVLIDNYYVNAEVSADGHNWSTAAYATDYVEKLWPANYGRRSRVYDFEGGEQPTASPTAGFIWDACARANVSFRSYGEFTNVGRKVGDPSTTKDKTLQGHFDPYYRGWDLDYSDVERFKQWERELSEFEKNGGLPKFSIIRLPNDHTAGTRKGALTPQAYVAQNDYALGLFVERISKSKFWKESAIFVTEDDAQDGPDHVDAHRSVALVVSPYTKRRSVDRAMYTTASMLRTMELILGIPPMSQFDAAATPMFASFTVQVDTSRYVAEQPRYDLTKKNKEGDFGQKMMEGMNLMKEDSVPDRLFNEIIWRSIKGTSMPPPRYSFFSMPADSDE